MLIKLNSSCFSMAIQLFPLICIALSVMCMIECICYVIMADIYLLRYFKEILCSGNVGMGEEGGIQPRSD